MTTAIVIVVALRIIVPFSIFRWRLSGALASMILDALDVVLVDVIATALNQQGGFGDHYQTFDKWLDVYYLSFEAIVSLMWANHLARNTSIALFVFRLVGIVAFEITGIRKLIFFFPNLFENFFLYIVVVEKFFPKLMPKNLKQLALVLVLLYIPKFGQEWLLHYQQAQPWNWFKEVVLRL